MAVEINEKSKLTVKDLGNPKRAAADNKEVVLGTIIGNATGTKVKVDAAGNAHEAIIGMFEGRSADGQTITRSSMLYLPGGFHEGIVEQLKTLNGASAAFAQEIKAVPAANAAGYSYAMRSLVKVERADPLAALRNAVGYDSGDEALPQVEGPKAAEPTPETAPEKPAKK